MLTNLRSVPREARNSTANNGSKPAAKTGSEFSNVCRSIVGKDAGQRLALLTGYPERTCYRYAAGHVPPADFLAKLFASDVGEDFFNWFMQGNQARWWQYRERHRRMGETIDNVR
jgi:hypothetical protein